MAFTKPSESGSEALLSVRVAEIADLTSNVRQFILESDIDLPAASPGAHIDVHLPGGPVRQYSLIAPHCGPRRYVIAVKRENTGRGGSIWLHDQAREGMALNVSAPRNHFELDETSQSTLLIAGGIGITPIYAMYQRLRTLGQPVHLHYWCKSPEETLFLNELRAAPDVTLHYPSETRTTAGMVTSAAPAGAFIYCCGPERLLLDCENSVSAGRQLRMERFSPLSDSGVTEKSAFMVHLAKSGRDILVPEGKTILAALLEADVDALYSCEEGVCGACETTLLSGEAIHLDSVRKPADHERLRTIMICCSRAKSASLTLDL